MNSQNPGNDQKGISPRETGLILVSGNDSPGVTEALFGTLSPFQIRILDIEQVVIRGRLILTCLISLDPAHAKSISDDLLETFERMDLDVAIDFQDSGHESASTSLNSLHVVVLSADLKPAGIAAIAAKIAERRGNIERIRRTASYPLTAIELDVSLSESATDLKTIQRELAQVASAHGVDLAVEQGGLTRRAKRIVLLDMDSTLIQEEVIDLLAIKAGVGDAVASITARAMAGDLDFKESLSERVSLLANLDETILHQVASEITLTPGARTLIRTLHRLGHKVGVVSGGFLNVIEPLLKELKIDFYRANTLEITNGKLTGRTTGEIIDRDAKAQALKDFAKQEGVALNQTIAIGDGANDLGMLETAGLGIAFNAKPAVKAVADSSINSPYLDTVLYLMGITRDEIVHADHVD